MKLISSHLGQVIVALACVALLITSIVFFKAPVSDFYNRIVAEETGLGDKILANIDNIDVQNLDAAGGINDNHSGEIPKGGVYTARNGNVYEAGADMPTPVTIGDVYTYSDYEYTYSANGWIVSTVADTTKKKYDIILATINNESIWSMAQTFKYCSSLEEAPEIPDSVKVLTETFMGCSALTVAPEIPVGVIEMQSTFEGCSVLSDISKVVLPEGITGLTNTFKKCAALVDASNLVIPGNVTSLTATFQGCSVLTDTPTIPNTVKSMKNTFYSCKALETAPAIPSSVTNLTSTFNSCTALTGDLEVNSNPTTYDNFLMNTVNAIKIVGSCSDETKENLKLTANRGNVTY